MSKKGYGSHPFIYEYIRNKKCRRIMEIGIADGDNAANMIEAALENFPPQRIEYFGFDKFDKKSQLQKVKNKLSEKNCKFRLYKGNSVKTISEQVENLPKMDLIFIDGGHDYPIVQKDWKNSKKLINEKTGVFFHNYNFSGPKKGVNNISKEKFSIKILDPDRDYKTALVKKRK
ncbi:hypothetical protein AKJ50_01360 [candidate division MSBL1 archaeon SCGC-AAA382A13]|uniref:Methyltransferase domain-containing protein n=1 Tax=candidate division MSBL1 archaeon SCGC-AAA382A13 TaxID=1698279 RepID=A0A133VFQ4_9EURY|nr:hypothetical protein AKJ50_01360 [candidate division MSBL1 archaeon SCGC-AAA382A13]